MLNSEMSLLTGNVKLLILETVYGLSSHRDRVFDSVQDTDICMHFNNRLPYC
jgi:hypothetical protein